MTGLLAAEGIRVCQLRVGRSLQRIDPDSHHERYTSTYRLTNPVPYQSSYCGEKLHVDQNVMFGVTHVCAVDGHSGKIVSFVTMPTMPLYMSICIGEYILQYHIGIILCRYIVTEYGLWNQNRVDKVRKWF